MLTLRKKATIKHVAVRKEFEGEESVPALTIKLLFEDVKSEIVEKGLVSGFERFFSDGDPITPDVDEFHVDRRIQNCNVTIEKHKLESGDIDGIRVTPKSQSRADVLLTVKIRCNYQDTAVMHSLLNETAVVSISQRQLELLE